MFKRTFSFGYMKPVFERHFVEQHALRYDETLRIGEDYIFMASALAKGGSCAVEPIAGYVYRIRAGSISRVLQLHHVEAMLLADAAFVRSHALDPGRLESSGEANPQPEGSGLVPVACPAPEGQGATQGHDCCAKQPARATPVENAGDCQAAPICRVVSISR